MLAKNFHGPDGLTKDYRKAPKLKKMLEKVLSNFPGLEAEPGKELTKVAELAEYYTRHKVLINELNSVKHKEEIDTIWVSLKSNETESEYQQIIKASSETLVHPRAIKVLIDKRNETA